MIKSNYSSVYQSCTPYKFHKLTGHKIELCALWKSQSHVGPCGDQNDYSVKFRASTLALFHQFTNSLRPILRQ